MEKCLIEANLKEREATLTTAGVQAEARVVSDALNEVPIGWEERAMVGLAMV